jgi:hypothetical protein
METEYLSVSVHNEFAKRVEEENGRQNHRLSSLESTVSQIATIMQSVERLATNMEFMANEQKKQGERLSALESRDGEKWRSVVSHVTFSIISLILGYLASKLGA